MTMKIAIQAAIASAIASTALAAGGCVGTNPPPGPMPRYAAPTAPAAPPAATAGVQPSPALAPAPGPAARQSPCVVLTTAFGNVQTVQHDQIVRGGDGDEIHAGAGDRIVSGPARLVVLTVDLATGATRPRAEIPINGEMPSVEGAAFRGDEIALIVRDENGQPLYARIDLAARRYEAGSHPISFEESGRGSMLASDGDAYYRVCRQSYRSYLCRGKDWEVRGSRVQWQGGGSFDGGDAIAISGGELYAIDDANVRVLDLTSGKETRRFALAGKADASHGVGIVGDELVIAQGRDSLARFDRRTGAARGTVRVQLPAAAFGFHLTCAAAPAGTHDARPAAP